MWFIKVATFGNILRIYKEPWSAEPKMYFLLEAARFWNFDKNIAIVRCIIYILKLFLFCHKHFVEKSAKIELNCNLITRRCLLQNQYLIENIQWPVRSSSAALNLIVFTFFACARLLARGFIQAVPDWSHGLNLANLLILALAREVLHKIYYRFEIVSLEKLSGLCLWVK